MAHDKFDPAQLDKLNDPGRFETMRPEVMQRALGESGPKVIVDVGAGAGLFSAKWLELWPGATVFAVDMEPRALRWIREHRPEVATGRIVPVASSEIHVPLDDGMADLVTMLNLHHELAEPDVMYREAHRLLRCGGHLLVVDWAPVESPKGPPLHVRIGGNDAVAHVTAAGFCDAEAHEGLPYHWLVTAEKR